MPHATKPYEKTGIRLGDGQFAQSPIWKARGLMALCGMGVEPGFSDVAARYAADELFSEIHEIGVRDGADLVVDGYDFARFRAGLRDQLMVERVREREVYQRIRISDLEVDRLVDQQRAAAQADVELNIAQILVTVPEGSSATERAARRARAERALARVRAANAAVLH